MSPSARNATAEGMTKNAIWRRPPSSRFRSGSVAPESMCATPDMAGSSAADTDMPNKLTGSRYSSCAFNRPATAPVGSRLASRVSMYALTCTAPRLMNTGPKLRTTVRTSCDATSSANRTSGATRNTGGSWMAIIAALPTTDPQPRVTARRGSESRGPKNSSVAIIATFQMTGAVYDSRKR